MGANYEDENRAEQQRLVREHGSMIRAITQQAAMFRVGQECELRWRDEAGEFWRRVRVVEPYVYSDGTGVWVKLADRIGNSFPVSPGDLRPASGDRSPKGEGETG